MASLIVNTGSATHPQIAITQIDLERDQITFRWLDGPYSGDCSESFSVSLSEHGDMTLNEVAAMVAGHMLSLLAGE